uniref:Disease resistance protein RGA3 n=1 Tax=Elaeis guineensis var. tenera TaxID=51953 RepID=A0A6I9QDZ5_ELAGV|nr:putative disease resistance protein RGA3 [Elaeis guineensis]
MAEVVASSLLRLVFDKLGNKILKEFGLSMGVDKHLKKLESTLSTIYDVLEDAEARQVKEKALRGWLRELKDVAYNVDDLLDEVAAEAMKRRSENRGHITGKVFSGPYQWRLCAGIQWILPVKIVHWYSVDCVNRD